MVVGAWLGFKTRSFTEELNWSNEIAAVIYTSCVVLVMSIPLGFLLTGSSTMVTVLKGIAICVSYIATTTFVIWDSLKRIILGKEGRTFSSANSVSRTNTQTGGTSVA